jgi:hypothetical protein
MLRLINDSGRFDIGGAGVNGRVETLSKIHFSGAGGLANLHQLHAFDVRMKNSGALLCQTPQ